MRGDLDLHAGTETMAYSRALLSLPKAKHRRIKGLQKSDRRSLIACQHMRL
jgi:hypothetical protein